MGSSPGTPAPSQEELETRELQKQLTQKQLDAQNKAEAQTKAQAASDAAATAAGRTGVRSLLSGDWAGFQRGGDLSPR